MVVLTCWRLVCGLDMAVVNKGGCFEQRLRLWSSLSQLMFVSKEMEKTCSVQQQHVLVVCEKCEIGLGCNTRQRL